MKKELRIMEFCCSMRTVIQYPFICPGIRDLRFIRGSAMMNFWKNSWIATSLKSPEPTTSFRLKE